MGNLDKLSNYHILDPDARDFGAAENLNLTNLSTLAVCHDDGTNTGDRNPSFWHYNGTSRVDF